VRVISGKNRGQKLIEIEGQDIRPTTDRVKEAIFSMLFPFIDEETSVLDLFGGTGALAIEALSRGAGHVVIVDQNRTSCDVISKNLENTRNKSLATLETCDAISFLQKTDQKFSIIFLDPPYNKGLISTSLSEIAKGHILKEDGIIVVERDHTEAAPVVVGLVILKEKKYGRTYITLYQND
jgi:RNA methyltransferase, RsmD family